MSERLDQALAQVREDIGRIDFWARVMGAFAQPVPAYDPEQSLAWFQRRPLVPGRPAKPPRRRRKAPPAAP